MVKKAIIEITLVDESSEKTNKEIEKEISEELSENMHVIPWAEDRKNDSERQLTFCISLASSPSQLFSSRFQQFSASNRPLIN